MEIETRVSAKRYKDCLQVSRCLYVELSRYLRYCGGVFDSWETPREDSHTLYLSSVGAYIQMSEVSSAKLP